MTPLARWPLWRCFHTADNAFGSSALREVAAAVMGFLVWNFPRVRVFMGDAGSGFLGITLGVMSLQAGWVKPDLFWAWVILLGVFIVDATVKLLRRLLRGGGAKAEVVETVPGWTHDITNIGEDEMVVMLWANEVFDCSKPDTYACSL